MPVRLYNLSLRHRIAAEGFFAVVAFELGLTALFADVEAAFHRLAVAGAVGIRAAEHFGDFVWQGEPAFVDDFEVVDGVDDGFGGEEGEAVGGVVVQPDAGDFDDVFAALGFAGQVEADGYGAAVVQQFELAQDNQAFACGDVVDDGAFFDGFDAEFWGFHICSLYRELTLNQYGVASPCRTICTVCGFVALS